MFRSDACCLYLIFNIPSFPEVFQKLHKGRYAMALFNLFVEIKDTYMEISAKRNRCVGIFFLELNSKESVC